MLTKPFKPLALAFLVNLIISVEDKIKYKVLTYVSFLISLIKSNYFIVQNNPNSVSQQIKLVKYKKSS